MRYRDIVVLLLFLPAFGSVKGQDIPPPNPGLALNIVSGFSIEFYFNTFDAYYNGIPNSTQDTYIRVGAIYDWKLQFSTYYGELFTGTNPSNQMEVNNVGVVVVSLGTNQDDGSNIINFSKAAPLALETFDVTLLTKGALTNKGYHHENQFILNWEMGTRQGNMNPTRMLDQMLANDTYTVTVVLTLSVY